MSDDAPAAGYQAPAVDESSQRRIAENEVTFRQVNEAIEPRAGTASYVCECGRLGCSDTIELEHAQYEAVRTSFDRFVIRPGHQTEVDRVVEDHEGYLVVEKVGDAAGEVLADEDRRDESAAGEAAP